MEKWRFNSILSNVELGYRCRLTKGMDPFATDWEYLAKTSKFNSISEDPILNDTDKKTPIVRVIVTTLVPLELII